MGEINILESLYFMNTEYLDTRIAWLGMETGHFKVGKLVKIGVLKCCVLHLKTSVLPRRPPI